MNAARYFFVVALLFAVSAAQEDDEESNVIVQAPIGAIRGFESEEDEDGFTHFRFLGIPFAEPPVGPLRLKDPQPMRPWKGVLNATRFGSKCPQFDFFASPPGLGGDEDCLFLNVYTPRLPASRRQRQRPAPSSTLLPVMAFIHGGGFVTGSGDLEPATLLKKDVIVVSMNYRLGMLGFMNLNNPALSGNQGLKDQLEALRWIQRNIASFGGDARKVTIFGISAGGMSTHYHQLSPQGEGLYRAAIVQSGTALTGTPSFTSGRVVVDSHRFANDFNCTARRGDVIRCLQELDVTTFHEGVNALDLKKVLEAERNGSAPYLPGPSLDPLSPSPFLPEHPLKTLQRGGQKDIPTIIGWTADEGALFTAIYWTQLDTLSSNWSDIGGSMLTGKTSVDLTPMEKIKADVLRHFYIGNANFTNEKKQDIMDLYSDAIFVSPSVESLRYQAERQSQPIFAYQLSEKPSTSFAAFYAPGLDEDFGVAHGDDGVFLFDVTEELAKLIKDDPLRTEADFAIREHMTTMWTNFAKHGDPTPYQDEDLPDWKTFDPETQAYMSIKAEPEIEEGVFPARMYFWQRFYWDDLERKLQSGTSTPSLLQLASPPHRVPLPMVGGRPRVMHRTMPVVGPFRFMTTASRPNKHFQ